MRLIVERLWDGSPAHPVERVVVEVRAANAGFRVSVDAPFHDDPPPPCAVGPTPGLWNHEVVELFLFGDERYLEVELGPLGHYLVLELHGARNVVNERRALRYRVHRQAGRWHGEAELPADWLPPGLARANAHAIHGQGEARRYLSALPASGERPDFHRAGVGLPLELPLAENVARDG